MFMVRCKIPGGRLTADQYLAIDDIAGNHANGTLRFTTRQSIQFHGILKTEPEGDDRGINQTPADHARRVRRRQPQRHGLPGPASATRARRSCSRRPTTWPPPCAPRTAGLSRDLAQRRAGRRAELSTHEQSRSTARSTCRASSRPAFALPHDNCIDVYAQDLGFLAIVEHGEIVGYNVLVGGGMGMTHGNANTFPLPGQADLLRRRRSRC